MINFKTLQYLTVIITLAFVANGCKKSGELKTSKVIVKADNADLSGAYQISNTLNVSNMMMYTMNGQVTDQGMIKDFITRKHTAFAGFFVLNATSVPAQFGGNEVNFKNGGAAATWSGFLPGYGLNAPSEYNVVNRSLTGFMLEAVDTTKDFPISYELPGTRADLLFSNSNASNKLSNCRTIPPAADYPTVCSVRNTYPFTIKDGRIYLSMYNCAIISSLPGGGISAYAEGNLTGVFDTEITRHLVVGDTIVYQNSNILFNKK